jgi:ABC-type uncharacterized transport system permease subunit
MDVLYGIPVLGVIAQLIGYLIETFPRSGPILLGFATPLTLGALCGIFNERSGVVNIGIEGMMLTSAFVAFLAAGLLADVIPADPSPILGITPALLFGVLIGAATGVLVSLLHAWLSITIRADQIISGTIINIAALGITGYLSSLIIQGNPRLGAGIFRSFDPPDFITGIPVLGPILNMFLAKGPIALSVILCVVVVHLLLFRSRWGLRTRAVGEHPKAADTVGIDVIRLRYRNVLIGGVFAGLAGAFLTLESNGSFQNGMTAGKGFIALACVIFGRWTPIGAFGGALLFAAADTIGITVQGRIPGDRFPDLANFFGAIPAELYTALPYIVTLIVLAGVVGRSVAPAAIGRPYEKESRA